MDYQAFAQLLGNYGEFVGAVGVVVTLAYLAVQIRQNSAQLRLNSYQVSTERYAEVIANVLEDSEKFAGVKSALNNFESSAPEHQALFHSQVFRVITAIQHSQELLAAGAIPESVLVNQKKDLARILKSPGGGQWMKMTSQAEWSGLCEEALLVGADQPALNSLPFFSVD